MIRNVGSVSGGVKTKSTCPCLVVRPAVSVLFLAQFQQTHDSAVACIFKKDAFACAWDGSIGLPR